MIRNPAVAGQFYSGTREALLRELDSLVDKKAEKEDALGAVSPHAGYMYSGQVAGRVISRLAPKKTYVIMGPNHTGIGIPFGISKCDMWKTPIGEVGLDRALASEIKKNSSYVDYDDLSSAHEHSIEVQLPFLQFFNKDFKFVPMVISYADIAVYRDIGNAIAKAVKGLGLEDDTTIIASSDMTHYEPQAAAKKKDSAAIEAILKLDEQMLLDRVSDYGISMCGFAPTAIMLAAAKALGAKKAKLVRYQTSGDVSGDYDSVVGYAGIIITK